MTSKEKTLQLIELFWTETKDYVLKEPSMSKKQAVQCALIAVDEIIKANPYKWVSFMDQYTETVLTSNIEYWQEVKQELEKIRDN
jgi:hypothetical protein